MDNSNDRFAEQLKADAEAIPADVSPELAERLRASIHATEPLRSQRPRPAAGFRWWLMSSLTGVAALFLVLVVVNRGAQVTTPVTPGVADREAAPATAVPPLVDVPLDVRTADFAEPLADELDKLKSDLEKARDRVENDLRFTL